jgi:hypothetical protein
MDALGKLITSAREAFEHVAGDLVWLYGDNERFGSAQGRDFVL